MSSIEENSRHELEDMDPDDDWYNFSAPDIDYILISSINLYASALTTDNTRNLRCECTDRDIYEQEMVVTRDLFRYNPVIRRSTNNAPRDEALARRRRVIEEGVFRYAPAPSLSSQDSVNNALISDRIVECQKLDWSHAVRLLEFTNVPQPSFDAVQVADRVINYARAIRNVREKDMYCLNCGFLPAFPVTGQCGHTRCATCVRENGKKCPCGYNSPEMLHENVLLRHIITKAESTNSTRIVTPACNNLATGGKLSPFLRNKSLIQKVGPMRLKYSTRIQRGSGYPRCSRRIPMSPQARYNQAIAFLREKQYSEAAPLLALAAASCHQELKSARVVLAQVISVLSGDIDPRLFHKNLNRSVRQLLSISWAKMEDLECILCCDPFDNPVTTPCGHTFCRICLERTLDYCKRCPLCQRSMETFNLTLTRETVFIRATLTAINALRVSAPLEPDFIPIFVCTVAYPCVPCPLFIFDPRYWLMIRRVLDSGSRQFGMVAYERDSRYAHFGTILEVKDCVHLEDGRSILSTIGVTRFRVIERGVRDGCEVARIRPIIDVRPNTVIIVKKAALCVMLRALSWLMRLDVNVIRDIYNTFGMLPKGNFDDDWWNSRDGPAWLWWLIAVLPLREEIKVLILATDCLHKRLLAVSRILEKLNAQPILVRS